MAKKPTRGGKRPGAGRKPIGSEAGEQVTVRLTAAQREQCVSLAGTVQAGIRLLIDASFTHAAPAR